MTRLPPCNADSWKRKLKEHQTFCYSFFLVYLVIMCIFDIISCLQHWRGKGTSAKASTERRLRMCSRTSKLFRMLYASCPWRRLHIERIFSPWRYGRHTCVATWMSELNEIQLPALKPCVRSRLRLGVAKKRHAMQLALVFPCHWEGTLAPSEVSTQRKRSETASGTYG